ncbi:MAG: transglycosylase domain-containing protein [Clostridiales bacterium]|nr:transglycosylase domain-containing protein [Clostridiales bacterium]
MNYSKANNDRRRKSNHSAKKKVKNKVGVTVFRVFIALILIGCFATGGAVIGAYLGVIENAPKLSALLPQDEGDFTTFIYSDKTGEEVDRLDGGENREYAPFEEIPQMLRDAIVAIEDERFYSHDGVDVKSTVRAVYATLFEDSMQGGSTITQQLIKQRLGYKRNSIDTKLQEQYLAIEFEKNLTKSLKTKKAAKDHILEQYLNIVALGSGQIGVKAAAWRYFNKEMADLTLAECATIAAITSNPTSRSPILNPEGNKERQTDTLDTMLELEMITQTQYDEAVKEDVYANINTVNTARIEESETVHSYYTDAIIEQVIQDLMDKFGWDKATASNEVYTAGLSIYSLEDPAIQKIVDESMLDETLFPDTEFSIEVTYYLSKKNTVTGEETHYPPEIKNVKTMEEAEAFKEEKKNEWLSQSDEVLGEAFYTVPQPQVAMVIMDQYTGHVKAIAGGRGTKMANRGLNRATQSERQPGSVFKIVASFAPALDMGLITPATVIDDSPVEYPEFHYTPHNWWGSVFRGPKTVREAIAQSMNVITVKNMYATGIENCMKYLDRFGFTTIGPDDHVLAACLGGVNGILQTDVTAAYASMANGGLYNKPVFYSKVLDHNGNILLENLPEPEQILKRTSAFLLTDMMVSVINGGTGGRARFRNWPMHISGKTGTTTGTKDLTFVGYTPYYTAGIWMGYDQPKDMLSATEGKHIDLWRHIMERIHTELALEDRAFERPEGIASFNICTISGDLASDLCAESTRSELFAVGSQPTAHCSSHQTYEICTLSGKLATEFCPPETRESRIRSGTNLDVNAENITEQERAIRQAIDGGVTCDLHFLPTPTPFPQSLDGFDVPLIPPDNTATAPPVSGGTQPSQTDTPVIPPIIPSPTQAPPAQPTAQPTPQPTETPVMPIVNEGPLIP